MLNLIPLFFYSVTLGSFVNIDKPVVEPKWSSLNIVSQRLRQEQKPVLIDLYTDWCHWCKVMDKKTYANDKIIAYLEDKFYIAKLNAETKDTVSWQNKSYAYNDLYKINDFALYVTKGQAGFPSTVIITSEEAEPIQIAGYLEPKELEPILKYFGEGAYLTQSFQGYKRNFKSTW